MPENGAGSPRLEVATGAEQTRGKSRPLLSRRRPPRRRLRTQCSQAESSTLNTPSLRTPTRRRKKRQAQSRSGSSLARETEAAAAPLVGYFVSAVAAGSGVLLTKVDTRICDAAPSRT